MPKKTYQNKDSFFNLVIAAIGLGLLLSSCHQEEDAALVQQEVKQLKDMTMHNKIKSVPFYFETPHVVSYQAENLRSPFEEVFLLPASQNRFIKPLVLYPINMLKFVGTLMENGKELAYIMTPDNKLYPVEIGNEIGEHHGKVIRIETQSIDILEKEVETGKPIRQQVITLRLKDEKK